MQDRESIHHHLQVLHVVHVVAPGCLAEKNHRPEPVVIAYCARATGCIHGIEAGHWFASSTTRALRNLPLTLPWRRVTKLTDLPVEFSVRTNPRTTPVIGSARMRGRMGVPLVALTAADGAVSWLTGKTRALLTRDDHDSPIAGQSIWPLVFTWRCHLQSVRWFFRLPTTRRQHRTVLDQFVANNRTQTRAGAQ